MSKATICDVCREPIPEDAPTHVIVIDLSADGLSSGRKIDMCEACFTSPVILSEMRRTRTRKPKKAAVTKASRKRKATENPAAPYSDAQMTDGLGNTQIAHLGSNQPT